MAKISKDMLINDILAVDAGNAAILMAAGMHCIGCLAAAGETLEEAAAVHGLDPVELELEINDYLAKKEKLQSRQSLNCFLFNDRFKMLFEMIWHGICYFLCCAVFSKNVTYPVEFGNSILIICK